MKRNSFYTAAIIFVLLAITAPVKSQVAINATGAEPHTSSMLDVSSTTKGFLMPRMTQAQRNSISSPTSGLIIFQTDGTKGIYFYDGSLGSWVFQGSGTSTWDVDSNGINYQSGNIGIQADSDPVASLYVDGYPPINSYVSIFHNSRSNAAANGIKIKAGAASPSTSTKFIGFFKDIDNIVGAIGYDGSGNLILSTISDKSFKSNIHETKYSLGNLMKVKVRDFNWKENNKPSTGFVAQELYEVFPEAVIVPEDKNEPWMISPTTVIPVMVKSIQDQQKIIQSQEEKIKSLEDRLSAIEKLLAK